MKKYCIITFGCQVNKSDSERIAAKLEDLGYKSASNINEADLVVLNMCSVRQSAVDRIYGRARQIKNNSNKKYLLTGCILKKDYQKFKQMFDYVLPIKTLPYWKKVFKKDKFYYYPNQRDPFFCERYGLEYFAITPKYKNASSVYIPIATGCNNFCTYCVVPFTRGPLACRPIKDIVNECKNAIKNGVKEIWLISQNVNSYQWKDIDFSDLLKEIDSLPGKFWINFTSCHPKDFSEKLIKIIKNGKKISHYVSLPLQSGNNEILEKMGRPYSVADYKKIIQKLRQAVPDVHISTDIIVGFPGETEEQFQDTVNLFKEIGFDMAYIAEYSPRPQVAAAKIKETVSPREKQARRKFLTQVLEKTTFKKNKEYIGKETEVLIFRKTKGSLIGKTQNYKTVKISNAGPKQRTGEIIKAKIIGAIPWGLKGEIL